MCIRDSARGFDREDLLAPAARERWLEWRDSGAGAPPARDTVCSLGLDQAGVLSGACSTSGAAYKLRGRVGDSPIPGHGLYVHPRFGAAAATGSGELVMGLCSSFAAVEALRRGADPLEALVETLARVTDEHELALGDQVALIALTPDGRWASASLRAGYRSVVTTRGTHELVDPSVLLGDPRR